MSDALETAAPVREETHREEPYIERRADLIFSDRLTDVTGKGSRLIVDSRISRLTWTQLMSALAMIAASLTALGFWLVNAALRVDIFTAMVFLAQIATGYGVWTLLRSLCPRRFVFDLDRNVCRFRNVPGIGLKVPIDEIESIDILTHRGGAWVGLAYHGKVQRLILHVVHGRRGDRDRMEAEAKAKAFADKISQVIRRPMRFVADASVRMRDWR